MFKISSINFFFIILFFYFNCSLNRENVFIKSDSLSKDIFIYENNLAKIDSDSNEVEIENLFFEPNSFVKKILKFKPIDESKLEVIEISFHFFIYKDSFLEKIGKIKKSNLSKYFILEMTKNGVGHKKSESVLQVYYDKFTIKKSESNNLSDAISKYKKSLNESSLNFLEKKILHFETQELISIRDELIRKNTIEYSDFTILKKISSETKNDIIFQSKDSLILFNLRNETQFSKDLSLGLFQTKYTFDSYEAPLIIYKRNEKQ